MFVKLLIGDKSVRNAFWLFNFKMLIFQKCTKPEIVWIVQDFSCIAATSICLFT